MSPDALLRDLLLRADKAGLKEGRLAANAGLTPQGLSKAKARGDLRASTLEALGNQLGLELAWRPILQKTEAVERVRAGRLFQIGNKDGDKD